MKLPEPKNPNNIRGIATCAPKVAVVKTTPHTVLEDMQRAMDLAGIKNALQPGVTTILKDNISWHFPFPGANTTPW